MIRSSREVDLPSSATEISMAVISDTSSRIVRSPVSQTLDPPSMSLPLVLETGKIFTEVMLSPRTPHTREEHTTRVTLSKIDGIWYGSKARVESTSWSARRSSGNAYRRCRGRSHEVVNDGAGWKYVRRWWFWWGKKSIVNYRRLGGRGNLRESVVKFHHR